MSNSAIQGTSAGVATESQRGLVNGTDTRNLVFGGAALGFRNKIINGAMLVSQRYGITEYLNANGYSLDRFNTRLFGTTTGVFKVQQVTDAPTGFGYSLKMTCTTAQAGINNVTATSGGFGITHGIEGLNVVDLDFGTPNAKAFTLSFWVKSSQTGIFSVCVGNSAQDRAYGVAITIAAANTWEYKTITIPGDTTGTWLKDNGAGLNIIWGLGATTQRTITANAWSTGVAGLLSPLRVSTQTLNICETTNATFQITGVQLESGSVATPFENRPIGAELQLCQRYYQYRNTPDNASVTYGNSVTGNGCRFTLPLITTMRVSPTLTSSGSLTFRSGGTDVAIISLSINSFDGNSVIIAGTTASLGNGLVGALYSSGATSTITLSAEI